MSTQENVLDLIFGRWRSQILYAGVKLGIFDALGAGPKTAAVTAHELGLDPALAYRLLRGKARGQTFISRQSSQNAQRLHAQRAPFER